MCIRITAESDRTSGDLQQWVAIEFGIGNLFAEAQKQTVTADTEVGGVGRAASHGVGDILDHALTQKMAV